MITSGARGDRSPARSLDQGAVRWWRREPGQASIELLGVIPLCVALALGLGQLIAAAAARELAGSAAQAGAMAVLQGGDPERAARAAVPGWSRNRMAVRVRGGAVRVHIRPVALVPGAAQRLTATVVADAGPAR